MNNVFAIRQSSTVVAPRKDETGAVSRRLALASLLQQAASSEGEDVYSLMAALLDAHMDHGHCDEGANARIRDELDNLELLLALDIERLGLRRSAGIAGVQAVHVHR